MLVGCLYFYDEKNYDGITVPSGGQGEYVTELFTAFVSCHT